MCCTAACPAELHWGALTLSVSPLLHSPYLTKSFYKLTGKWLSQHSKVQHCPNAQVCFSPEV